jgi:hypothetical protein
VTLKAADNLLILNVGGGPAGGKPAVTLAPPVPSIKVAGMAAAYADWSAKRAWFLTEPKGPRP